MTVLHEEVFKDCYRVLEPSSIVLHGFPRLEEKATFTRDCSTELMFAVKPYYSKVLSLRFATYGLKYIQFLAVYADNNPHSYFDICQKFDLPYGYDKCLWDSLRDFEMITFANKGKYGRQFFKLTPLGREVLDIAEANNVYFRVCRWFKLKSQDPYTALVNSSLTDENADLDALEPKTFNACLDALLNRRSTIHRIGSQFRWMNNVIWLVKNDKEFCRLMSRPETLSWLECHLNLEDYYGVSFFLDILKKAIKRHKIS